MDEGRIFIVEDDSIILLELQARLEKLGYSVVGTASNGKSAVEKILNSSPEIILMDIMISGGMDGIDVARAIHLKADIPVIYLTAFADKTTLERAKLTEPYVYLVKPFNETELDSNIKVALYKHRIEEKTKKNEQWLNSILMNITDGIIATNIEEKIHFLNPVAENLTAWKLKDALNKSIDNILKIVHKDGKPLTNPFSSVIHNRTSVSLIENIFIKPRKGSLKPVHAIASPIWASKKIIGTVFILQDIAKQIKAETELKESEEKFRNLVESTNDWVWETDSDGKYVYSSPKVKDILGYLPEEIIGKSTFDLLDPSEYERVNEVLKKRRTVKCFENINLHKEGYPVILETSAVPVYDEDGYLRGFRGIDRDITERKQAEEILKTKSEELKKSRDLLEEKAMELMRLNDQLEKSRSELKELNLSKDKFFSILAHDLRSPFNSLLGFSKLLVEEYDQLSDIDRRTFIGNIYNSTGNLFHLVENLLEWSRVQSGRMDIRPVKINLRSIVMNIFFVLLGNAMNKKIELVCEIEEDVNVISDERALYSVFQNLISNAIKFTNTGGRVNVYSEEEENYFNIYVEDNGIGISEENIKKLFKIDVQYTTDGTAEEAGSGLGLILCKELVENNGGTISVKSKVGHGTIFMFTIPAVNHHNVS